MKLKKRNKSAIGVIGGEDVFEETMTDKKDNEHEIEPVTTRDLEIKKVRAFDKDDNAIEVIKADSDKSLEKRNFLNIIHFKWFLFVLLLIILIICLILIYNNYKA